MPHPATVRVPTNTPRVIAWEVTRRCPLACKHCRAGACDVAYEGELSTAECKRVIDSLPPNLMIIWTGGEPMSRPDILELVRHATQRGIRSVMAPCGLLVNESALVALKESGVMACSFSLDGATAATHDAFRGVEGTFAMVTQAMKVAQQVGMPFQVNCTVSQLNQHELPAIREQAIAHGAKTLDLFFLVPVGRGKALRDRALSPADTERVLRWAFEMDAKGPIHVRETCAPQAIRIWSALGKPGNQPAGCMGGKGFVFISHTGVLQPCGFLDVKSGDLHETDFDFMKAYRESKVFKDLSKPDDYAGFCGQCEFRCSCGGCRARAYAATGDYMGTETSCPLNRGEG